MDNKMQEDCVSQYICRCIRRIAASGLAALRLSVHMQLNGTGFLSSPSKLLLSTSLLLEPNLLDSSRKPGMPLRTVSRRSVDVFLENLPSLGGLPFCTSALRLVLACTLEYTRPPSLSSLASVRARMPAPKIFASSHVSAEGLRYKQQ